MGGSVAAEGRITYEDGLTPGDRVARCMTWLEANPDAELPTRCSMALVVASGGDENTRPTFGDVAEVLGLHVGEVFDALWSLLDDKEA